jgi:hypothetical protein
VRWYERKQIEEEHSAVVLPPAERPTSSSSSKKATASSVALTPKGSVNWDVPFTPQAPLANWDALHEEACEEASVLMVLTFFAGEQIASPDDAELAIQHLVAANEALGFPVDDTAAQIVTLISHEAPNLHASVLKNPSVDQLKSVLDDGALIIVPAAGQQLGNPYFQQPGPKYHMLVIRGYTSTSLITNDSGTRKGENYTYTFTTLNNATVDWNHATNDIDPSKSVIIVISK